MATYQEAYDNGDGTWTIVWPNGVAQVLDNDTREVVDEYVVGQQAALPPPVPAAQQPNPFSPEANAQRGSYGQEPYASPVGASAYGGVMGNAVGPAYRDGTTHPAFGGPPRTPGGQWNQGGSGGGPNVPRLPYSPTSGVAARGYGVSGGSSGGGGGGGSALYQAWRDKLTSKLYPGSGSSYSSYGSSGGGGGTYTTYEYPEEKMRGRWARQVAPTQAQSVMAMPSLMIPRVAPNLDSRSPMYQDIASMPLGQMATIMSSTKTSRSPEYPTTRYRKDGSVKQNKGDGGTIGSDTVNAIGGYVNQVANQERVPTFDQVAAQLRGTKKNSLLGMTVGNQPVGYGLSALQSTIDAGLSETLDPRSAAAYSQEAAALINRYGARGMRRDVGKGGNAVRQISRRLFNG